jgi:hypothetical protein
MIREHRERPLRIYAFPRERLIHADLAQGNRAKRLDADAARRGLGSDRQSDVHFVPRHHGRGALGSARRVPAALQPPAGRARGGVTAGSAPRRSAPCGKLVL